MRGWSMSVTRGPTPGETSSRGSRRSYRAPGMSVTQGPTTPGGGKFKREQAELQGTRYRDVKTQSVTVIRFFNS